jgi:hypothetical protein
METYIYELHLRAGLISGQERTCGKKAAHATEALAVKAAEAHNRWENRRHDVEAYPCAFCHQWHVGGIMPVSVLESICAMDANKDIVTND